MNTRSAPLEAEAIERVAYASGLMIDGGYISVILSESLINLTALNPMTAWGSLLESLFEVVDYGGHHISRYVASR